MKKDTKLGKRQSLFKALQMTALRTTNKKEKPTPTITNTTKTKTTKLNAKLLPTCDTKPTKTKRLISNPQDLKQKISLGKYDDEKNDFDITLHQLRDNITEEYKNLQHFNMTEAIRNIKAAPYDLLTETPWKFERTREAAEFNTRRLQEFSFDTNAATQTPVNTILSYGAEFRPISILEPLLSKHPDWDRMKHIIINGVEYPLRPIDNKTRLADIKAMLQRGNHQSTATPENKKALTKAMDKEVRQQWAIPIHIDCITDILESSVTPLGVAVQWSINEENERILKRRTTHDCTFPGPSGLSCNKRVIEELLEPCTYGHALKRFLHGIHAIRRRHPT
jgi:hypothetical protein